MTNLLHIFRVRAFHLFAPLALAATACEFNVFSPSGEPVSNELEANAYSETARGGDQEVRTNALKVLAFGDSGSCNNPENPALCKQNEVALAMQSLCRTKGCDLGIMLGDNIYEQGVRSADDDMFRYKYEYHYAPLKMQMYAALGNHDLWGTDISEQAQIDAQVAYSALSATWNMKSEYYDFVQGEVHFFVVSTNTFTNEQAQWLEGRLASSAARWKVVYGHHPIYSNGYHGDTYQLTNLLLPIVCKYASMYVAGHDHDLQFLNPECGVPMVISGAAGKTRFSQTDPTLENRIWSASNTYGFVRFLFDEDFFDIEFYDDKGIELFNARYNQRYYIQLRDAADVTTYDSQGTPPRLSALTDSIELNSESGLANEDFWLMLREGGLVKFRNTSTQGYISVTDDYELRTESDPTNEGIYWEFISPQKNRLFLRNRKTGLYLIANDDGQLVMSSEQDATFNGWKLLPPY